MQPDSFAPKAKNNDQYEFLPAALEVLETPPGPIGRIMALTIGGFFLLAVVWAWYGTIDVVAIAQGKTVPTGNVKIVQPLETGVVRAIHVEEGQRVKQGDLLIELDPTESTANIDTILIELAQAKLDIASGTALLAKDPVTAFVSPHDIDPELISSTKALVGEDAIRHQAELTAIHAEILRSEAAIRSANIEKEKLQKTIPLVEGRLEVQKDLLEKGLTQRPIVLALQQELYEQRAALATTAEADAQTRASIQSLLAREKELTAVFRARARERQRNGLRQQASLEQNLRKETQRQRYRKLRAPVDGTVDQLSIHTIGAVVNTAERLLVVVPDDAPLEIEAMLLNKDVGFAEVGQEAEIKLEAFPFTRYGTLFGELSSVSEDAIINERLGPVYKVKVSMNEQKFTVDERPVNLSPGMNVSVEIKTGSRRIIDYFLSPLLRYRDEAIRER